MMDRRHDAAGNLSRSAERIDLIEIAGLVPMHARVLDIGCGSGDLLALLNEERGVSGQGMELSQAGVNACVAQGLAVVQGDADSDLAYYPDNLFDAVILSQTLQALARPHEVLSEMTRLGERLIISIPNFAYWRVRFSFLLRGRMPVTRLLSANWYESANIHLCSLTDFVELANMCGLRVEQSLTLMGGRFRRHRGEAPFYANILAEMAVFVLRRDTPSHPRQ